MKENRVRQQIQMVLAILSLYATQEQLRQISRALKKSGDKGPSFIELFVSEIIIDLDKCPELHHFNDPTWDLELEDTGVCIDLSGAIHSLCEALREGSLDAWQQYLSDAKNVSSSVITAESGGLVLNALNDIVAQILISQSTACLELSGESDRSPIASQRMVLRDELSDDVLNEEWWGLLLPMGYYFSRTDVGHWEAKHVKLAVTRVCRQLGKPDFENGGVYNLLLFAVSRFRDEMHGSGLLVRTTNMVRELVLSVAGNLDHFEDALSNFSWKEDSGVFSYDGRSFTLGSHWSFSQIELIPLRDDGEPVETTNWKTWDLPKGGPNGSEWSDLVDMIVLIVKK